MSDADNGSPQAAVALVAPPPAPTPAASAAGLRYPRVLLKLSGEALAGERGFGYDFERVRFFADQIVDVVNAGAAT